MDNEPEIIDINTAKVLIIEKNDLAKINENRMREQQILSAIGMLEVKKVEMIAQIGQIKNSLEESIKFALARIGIDDKEFVNYAINPNNGEVVKKQQ
jgi:hypothetical protein